MSSRFGLIALAFLASAAIAAYVAGAPAAVSAQAPPLDEFIRACKEDSSNPWLVTARYAKGGEEDSQPSLVAFRDTPDNSGHIGLATAGQVGALYGLAYHGASATLYAAAFHKRGTHFGPQGPGAIYALDLRSGDIRPFATVPNAGPDYHSVAGDYFPDTRARFPVGKTSLGDLDISEDGSELAVVNLADRNIYRFSIPDGALLGSFPNGASGEGWSGDARPFGLGYRDGRLYHGVVNSAQSTDSRAQVRGYVYSSLPDGSDMRLEASADLAFDRGQIWPNTGDAIWNAWRDPPGQLDPSGGRYPMPLLSDIVFTGSADQMILGFRDRFGDMTFYTTPPNQPPSGEQIYNTPAGDILPAFREGGGWRIQTTPEYYTGDYGPNRQGNHDETSYGGLVVIPGHDIVAMSANSPQVISSAGVVWLNTNSGDSTAREQIYRFGVGDNFGKANGLGDMEVLCGTAEEETPTPTVTNTVTPTLTATAPATATETLTPTLTAPATSTATVTPTVTITATGTITATVTPVGSNTPGSTETATATAPATRATEVTPVPTTPGPTSPPRTSPPETSPPATPRITPPPEQPNLPKTGAGDDTGHLAALAIVVGVAMVAAGVLVRQPRLGAAPRATTRRWRP